MIQLFDVFLHEKDTNKHIGTRFGQTPHQVDELKKQFKELKLMKKPVKVPEPIIEPVEITEGSVDA
jgi:hypothetical protein